MARWKATGLLQPVWQRLQLAAELGPNERRTFRTPFDYNAVEHDLLECWLRVVSTGKEISIDAEQAY